MSGTQSNIRIYIDDVYYLCERNGLFAAMQSFEAGNGWRSLFTRENAILVLSAYLSRRELTTDSLTKLEIRFVEVGQEK